MSLPILIAGDSYSVKWPNQFSKLITNKITNISTIGRSNLYIWSSTINFLLTQKSKHLVIIGHSFIHRTDSWKEQHVLEGQRWEIPNVPETKKGNKSVPLQRFLEEYDAWYKNSDISTLWQKYYFDLYCFCNTLKYLGHDFFIFSAASNVMGNVTDDFQNYITSTPYYKWCHNQSNILPSGTFCIRDWGEKNNIKLSNTGHIEDDEGFLVFSKWLHKQLLQLKLL